MYREYVEYVVLVVVYTSPRKARPIMSLLYIFGGGLTAADVHVEPVNKLEYSYYMVYLSTYSTV
jgi:predicted secreted Zn-dependent protease